MLNKKKSTNTRVSSDQTLAGPFLKWAGGKSQLLEQFAPLFPPHLQRGRIATYVEPFVGAGAVFFHVAQNYPGIKRRVIIDINDELVLTYRVIAQRVDALIAALEHIRADLLKRSPASCEKMFYGIRESFNKNRAGFDFSKASSADAIARAAQVIFINKTCYNGLFRTNSRGEFNAPFGRYKKPSLFDEVNLRLGSKLLNNTEIRIGDFESSREFITSDSFVYFDPPYRPLSPTASFTAYSRGAFDDGQQRRLARYFVELDSQCGARLMLSNSDPTNINPDDRFFDVLYRGYQIDRVSASRMINSRSTKRGAVTEIVVRNYATR